MLDLYDIKLLDNFHQPMDLRCEMGEKVILFDQHKLATCDQRHVKYTFDIFTEMTG